MTDLRPWIQKDHLRLILLSIFYLVGLLGHLFLPTRELMLWMTPGFLGIFGILISIPYFQSGGRQFIFWLGWTYLLTFSLETLGVATGAIFGSYAYGPVLGWQVFQVPIVIGFNWTLVVLGAIELSGLLPLGGIQKQAWFIILFTAIISVGFDFILEPLAMGLDYWDWAENIIPLQNYAAWGLIATLGAGLWVVIKPKTTGYLAVGYLIIQILFFVGLRLGGLGV